MQLSCTRRKTKIVSDADSHDHLVKDCPKGLSKVARRVSLNEKRGMMKKGGQTPQKPVVAQLASPDEASRAETHPKKFSS